MTVRKRPPNLAEPNHIWEGYGGIRIAGDSFGERGGMPVLLVHGLSQTRHAWKQTGSDLAAAGYHVVAIDQRGHGDSDWSSSKDYRYEALIGDVNAVIAAEFGRPPVLVGASLGGVVSLIGLGEATIEGAGLVLVDIAHRSSRRGVTRVKAFVDTQGARGFDSIEAVADAVAVYQPNRARPDDISGLVKNLRIGEDGRYYWHWDPDYRGGRADQDPKQKYERLIRCTRSLPCPTLIIRGGSSDVLPEFAAAEFCEMAPHAEYVNVAGANHMIAGDRNDAFTEALKAFLLQRFPPL